VSIEVETHGHGLFTYHLLRGLRGAADRDGDGRVGVAELFEFVAEAVETDAKQLGFSQKPWNHSTGTGGVYLSRPRGLSGSSRPPTGDDEDREERNRNSIHQVERLFAEGPEDRLVPALDELRHLNDAEAVPYLFRGLAHPSRAVRERARKVVRSIGWERTTAAVELIARRGDPERIGQILDGLAAFESHRDVVALLERLVTLLRGDLRNRAILLWERKRLALDLEDVAEVFRAVGSPYQLQKALGQGLFTAAYLACDEQTDLNVVIRVLRPEFAAQPALRARFLDMARGSLRYVHQNLVLTREVRSLPDRKIDYVVRDYVEGVTLQRMLEAGKVFTPAQIVKILRQLLLALTPLHEASLPHGGIKPSNIFIRGDDRVVLGDPSLPLQGIHLALERLVYDYRYAAPETFRAGNNMSPACDFYAIGCVGYELACGTPPFVADSPFELATLQDRDPVIAPSLRGSLLGPGDALLLRLLAKTPTDRLADPDSALDTLGDLARAYTRRNVVLSPKIITPEGLAPPASLAYPPVEDSPLVGPASLIRYDMAESVVPMNTIDPSASVLPGLEHTAPPTSYTQGPRSDAVPEQFGRYRIIRRLGQGGMGSVYLAEDTQLQRQVALKVPDFGSHDYPEARRRFLTEARTAATLDHPYICPVYDVGEIDGRLYLTMAYIEGKSLAELIRGEAMPPRMVAALVIKLALALEAAHARGIIHRDLKPANVMIKSAGKRREPVIVDFGLARRDDPEEGNATRSGQVFGTLGYMSPEQVLGDQKAIGPASDIYTLGVILYELLTGRLPYTGAGLSVAAQILHDTAPSASKLNPGIDPQLDAICSKAMARRIEDRYASMEALAAALTDYLRAVRGESFATELSAPRIAPDQSPRFTAPAKESSRAQPPRRRSFWRRFLPF
jgi:serine/threonine protein kinase